MLKLLKVMTSLKMCLTLQPLSKYRRYANLETWIELFLPTTIANPCAFPYHTKSQWGRSLAATKSVRMHGWRCQVTCSPCRSPRDLMVVVCRWARYLLQSINFPLTNQFSTHKIACTNMKSIKVNPGKKTAGKLGWVVSSNMQSMPLTSGPAHSCALLRQVPNGGYQFSTHKIATRTQRCRHFAGKNSR